MHGQWWVASLVLVVIRVLSVEARLAHAERIKSALVFRATLGIRLMIGGAIIGFSTFILTHFGDQDRWAIVGLAGFVVLSCLVWPGTISITDFAIEQHIWWRRTAIIPWSEVSAIERSPSGDYSVYGVNGQKIAFDRFHVDGSRFRSEVQRRAKIKGVLDSKAPPTLTT